MSLIRKSDVQWCTVIFPFILYTLSSVFTAAASVDTDALNTQQSFATFAYKNNPEVGASTLMIALQLDSGTDSARNITISRKKHCADLTKTKGSPNKQRCQRHLEPLAKVSVVLTPSEGVYTCRASVATVNSQGASNNEKSITYLTKSADLARMAPIVEMAEDGDSFTTITYQLPQGVDGHTHSIRMAMNLDDLPKFTLSEQTNRAPTFLLVYDKDAATPRSIKLSS